MRHQFTLVPKIKLTPQLKNLFDKLFYFKLNSVGLFCNVFNLVKIHLSYYIVLHLLQNQTIKCSSIFSIVLNQMRR